MIMLSSERMIVGSLKCPLFVKNGLTVGTAFIKISSNGIAFYISCKVPLFTVCLPVGG